MMCSDVLWCQVVWLCPWYGGGVDVALQWCALVFGDDASDDVELQRRVIVCGDGAGDSVDAVAFSDGAVVLQ